MAEEAKKLGDALLRFQADTDEAVTLIVRGVGQWALGQVIQRSPVGQPEIWESKSAPPGYVGGRFKGNWQVTHGKPADGVVPLVDPSGAAVLQAGTVALASAPVEAREIWLTNNLPYSERLEDGWSKQAPLGIVARTMADILPAFDQAATTALNEKGLS